MPVDQSPLSMNGIAFVNRRCTRWRDLTTREDVVAGVVEPFRLDDREVRRT
jgi:hypothetical protein